LETVGAVIPETRVSIAREAGPCSWIVASSRRSLSRRSSLDSIRFSE